MGVGVPLSGIEKAAEIEPLELILCVILSYHVSDQKERNEAVRAQINACEHVDVPRNLQGSGVRVPSVRVGKDRIDTCSRGCVEHVQSLSIRNRGTVIVFFGESGTTTKPNTEYL